MVDWQRELAEGLAPSTVNGHLASLSGFCTWVMARRTGHVPARPPDSWCVGFAAAAAGTTNPRRFLGAVTQEPM